MGELREGELGKVEVVGLNEVEEEVERGVKIGEGDGKGGNVGLGDNEGVGVRWVDEVFREVGVVLGWVGGGRGGSNGVGG